MPGMSYFRDEPSVRRAAVDGGKVRPEAKQLGLATQGISDVTAAYQRGAGHSCRKHDGNG
jgi:hypothetical protein